MSVSTDAVLFYGITNNDDINYKDIFDKLGIEYDKDTVEDYGFDKLWDFYLPLGLRVGSHGWEGESRLYFYPANKQKFGCNDFIVVNPCGEFVDIDSLPIPDEDTVKLLTEMAEKLEWDEPGCKLVCWRV